METPLEDGPNPGQEHFTYYGKAYETTRARLGYSARAPTQADVDYEHAAAPELDTRTLSTVKRVYKCLRELTPRRSHDADAKSVQDSVNTALEELMMIPVPPQPSSFRTFYTSLHSYALFHVIVCVPQEGESEEGRNWYEEAIMFAKEEGLGWSGGFSSVITEVPDVELVQEEGAARPKADIVRDLWAWWEERLRGRTWTCLGLDSRQDGDDGVCV